MRSTVTPEEIKRERKSVCGHQVRGLIVATLKAGPTLCYSHLLRNRVSVCVLMCDGQEHHSAHHHPSLCFLCPRQNSSPIWLIKKKRWVMYGDTQSLTSSPLNTNTYTNVHTYALGDNLGAVLFACFCVLLRAHVVCLCPERPCLPVAKVPLTFAVVIKVWCISMQSADLGCAGILHVLRHKPVGQALQHAISVNKYYI